MSSYQYGKSHCGDRTILRPSYLHNGISYTGKMSSLYWIGALGPGGICLQIQSSIMIGFFNTLVTVMTAISLTISFWCSVSSKYCIIHIQSQKIYIGGTWNPSPCKYLTSIGISIMKIIHYRRIFTIEIHLAGRAILHELPGSKVIWHFTSADSGLLRSRGLLTRIIMKPTFVRRFDKQ